MNKNTKIIIAVVVVLAIVVVVAAVFLMQPQDVTKDAKEMETSELKMYGNINGDGFIDDKDTKIIKGLIDQGKTAKDYPLADANQDGKLTQHELFSYIKVREEDASDFVNGHILYVDGGILAYIGKQP